jgi:hypothetical protein
LPEPISNVATASIGGAFAQPGNRVIYSASRPIEVEASGREAARGSAERKATTCGHTAGS